MVQGAQAANGIAPLGAIEHFGGTSGDVLVSLLDIGGSFGERVIIPTGSHNEKILKVAKEMLVGRRALFFIFLTYNFD